MIDLHTLLFAYRDARDAEREAALAALLAFHAALHQEAMRGPRSPGAVAAREELARREADTSRAKATSAAILAALLAPLGVL